MSISQPLTFTSHVNMIRRGDFGQDYFTLTSSCFQGRPPKSVNMYWRRFALNDIPLRSHEEFELWIRARWYEKDALMEQYMTTGRFPNFDFTDASKLKGVKNGFIETEVKPKYEWEVAKVFTIPALLALMANLARKASGALF